MKNKKFLLVVLSVVMFLASVGFFVPSTSSKNAAVNAAGASVWDGQTMDESYHGFGTAEEPYQITSAPEFVSLRDIVNNSALNNSNVHFVLMVDVDLDGYPYEGIGSYGHAFKAHLDGNNKTISNFLHMDVGSIGDTYCAGLFNCLQGSVKDLTVVDSGFYLNSIANKTGSSSLSLGGFAGIVDNGAKVENVAIKNLEIEVNLSNNHNPAVFGGFAGECTGLSASIKNCYVEGLSLTLNYKTGITRTYTHCGGMVGRLSAGAKVEMCYADSPFINLNQASMSSLQSDTTNNVGAFVGQMNGLSVVRQCYATIDSANLRLSVASNNASKTENKVGGFVGEVQESNIIDCYAKNNLFAGLYTTTNVESTSYVGGLIGKGYANTNLFASAEEKVFLKNCYVVVGSAAAGNHVDAAWGAVAGQINVSAAYENASTSVFDNVYYIAKNGQNIDNVYNITGGSEYQNSGIFELSNSNAKSLLNFANFDEMIWHDDVLPQINEGYPILRGVGNDIEVPNVGYQITLKGVYYDENEDTTPVKITSFKVADNGSRDYHINCPDGYAVDSVVAVNENVALLFNRSTNVLTLSNATAEDVVLVNFKKTYTITTTVNGQGGTISFAQGYTQTAMYDGKVELVVAADVGYAFYNQSGLQTTGLCNVQTDENNITLTNIKSDVEVVVSFVKTYGISIVASNAEMGAVSFDGANFAGSMQKYFDAASNITAKAKVLDAKVEDCKFVCWQDQSGATVTTNTTLTIQNLQQDVQYVAVFAEIEKFDFSLNIPFADVTYNVYKNGSVIPTEERAFKATDKINFSLNIPNGYQAEGFYYDQNYNIPMQAGAEGISIAQDTVVFVKMKAQIKLGTMQNGAVTLNGFEQDVWCYAGEQVEVVALADLGYQLLQFEGADIFDGKLIVDGTKTIVALFESKPVTIVLSSTEQGNVYATVNGAPFAETSTYKIGDVVAINTNVNTIGYHFEGYMGSFCGSLANNLSTTYTIVPQDAENGTIEIFANVVIDTFEVAISSNYGGMLSVYGTATYQYGHKLEIDVEIYDMYVIKDIFVNNMGGYTVNSLCQIFFDIVQNYDIYFEFEPLLWWDVAQKPQGAGTEENPYLITNANELAFVSFAINNNMPHDSGSISYAKAYYKLADDINLLGRFWHPIGTNNKRFNGVFDFDFHKVLNLFTIDDTTIYKYGGLFDIIGPNGKIINQFRSYTTELLIVCGGSILIVLSITLVVVLEKHRRKPKRVIILPAGLTGKQNNTQKPIKKPDLTKLNKK